MERSTRGRRTRNVCRVPFFFFYAARNTAPSAPVRRIRLVHQNAEKGTRDPSGDSGRIPENRSRKRKGRKIPLPPPGNLRAFRNAFYLSVILRVYTAGRRAGRPAMCTYTPDPKTRFAFPVIYVFGFSWTNRRKPRSSGAALRRHGKRKTLENYAGSLRNTTTTTAPTTVVKREKSKTGRLDRKIRRGSTLVY